MSKRKRGELAKEVRKLCLGLCNGKSTDNQFREGIEYLLLKHGRTGYVLQGIGLAVHRNSSTQGSDFENRVWTLASQVDSRIRELYDNWCMQMQK